MCHGRSIILLCLVTALPTSVTLPEILFLILDPIQRYVNHINHCFCIFVDILGALTEACGAIVLYYKSPLPLPSCYVKKRGGWGVAVASRTLGRTASSFSSHSTASARQGWCEFPLGKVTLNLQRCFCFIAHTQREREREREREDEFKADRALSNNEL